MTTPARPPLTPFGSALAGALGAVFANAAVYPLDTVKTRLQALPNAGAPITQPSVPPAESRKTTRHGPSPLYLARAVLRKLKRWEMLNMLIRIIRTEGVSGAFKGFSANMVNTFSQQFAYFFFHTFLRSAAQARLQASNRSPSLSTTSELSLGALAGGLAQIFTIPVAVIATRQQLWTPSSTSTIEKEPTFTETAKEIVSEGGVTALWTGLKPGLVLTVNPAITYGVFERLKSWRLKEGGRPGGKLGVMEAFWLGVASKTLATVVTYPYIFAKVRLQAKQTPAPEPIVQHTDGKDENSYAAVASSSSSAPGAHATHVRPSGAIQLLKDTYAEKGFAGWYQGLGAQIVKAVLCQGILFVSKDQFEGSAWIILDQIARLRGLVV